MDSIAHNPNYTNENIKAQRASFHRDLHNIVQKCHELCNSNTNIQILLSLVETSKQYFFYSSKGTPKDFYNLHLKRFPSDKNIEILLPDFTPLNPNFPLSSLEEKNIFNTNSPQIKKPKSSNKTRNKILSNEKEKVSEEQYCNSTWGKFVGISKDVAHEILKKRKYRVKKFKDKSKNIKERSFNFACTNEDSMFNESDTFPTNRYSFDNKRILLPKGNTISSATFEVYDNIGNRYKPPFKPNTQNNIIPNAIAQNDKGKYNFPVPRPVYQMRPVGKGEEIKKVYNHSGQDNNMNYALYRNNNQIANYPTMSEGNLYKDRKQKSFNTSPYQQNIISPLSPLFENENKSEYITQYEDNSNNLYTYSPYQPISIASPFIQRNQKNNNQISEDTFTPIAGNKSPDTYNDCSSNMQSNQQIISESVSPIILSYQTLPQYKQTQISESPFIEPKPLNVHSNNNNNNNNSNNNNTLTSFNTNNWNIPQMTMQKDFLNQKHIRDTRTQPLLGVNNTSVNNMTQLNQINNTLPTFFNSIISPSGAMQYIGGGGYGMTTNGESTPVYKGGTNYFDQVELNYDDTDNYEDKNDNNEGKRGKIEKDEMNIEEKDENKNKKYKTKVIITEKKGKMSVKAVYSDEVQKELNLNNKENEQIGNKEDKKDERAHGVEENILNVNIINTNLRKEENMKEKEKEDKDIEGKELNYSSSSSGFDIDNSKRCKEIIERKRDTSHSHKGGTLATNQKEDKGKKSKRGRKKKNSSVEN